MAEYGGVGLSEMRDGDIGLAMPLLLLLLVYVPYARQKRKPAAYLFFFITLSVQS